MIKLIFKDSEWADKSFTFINNEINKILKKKSRCNLILTGGRCAKKIYNVWSNHLKKENFNKLYFYLTDERNVPTSNENSNYKMISDNLFLNFEKKNLNFYKFETELKDKKKIIDNYNNKLPNTIDITLLSIGDDGHVASIFPNDMCVINSNSNVSFVHRKLKPDRFTVTPKYLLKSKKIFLLASEYSKKKAVSNLINNKKINQNEMPAFIFKDYIWLIDKDLL